jgi:hypothetical protein
VTGHRADRLVDANERLARLLDDLRAGVGALGAVLDRNDGLIRLGLDRRDDLRDLARGAVGFLRELSHLLGHDREPAALLTGPGRLDRGVERQQVGLRRDPGDRLHDRADLL